MHKANWPYIGRGFNGWHANGNGSSSSGGILGDYVREARDGAVVVDAAHLEVAPDYGSAFSALVISGPMLDPSLPENGYRVCLERETREIDPENPPKIGSFDYVGMGVFVSMRRKVGARIGVVRAGKVEWEGFNACKAKRPMHGGKTIRCFQPTQGDVCSECIEWGRG